MQAINMYKQKQTNKHSSVLLVTTIEQTVAERHKHDGHVCLGVADQENCSNWTYTRLVNTETCGDRVPERWLLPKRRADTEFGTVPEHEMPAEGERIQYAIRLKPPTPNMDPTGYATKLTSS